MTHQSPQPSTISLSLATVPFLLSLGAAQCLAQTLRELGQASEEVFRGERLPVLKFPQPEEQENSLA